MILRRFMKDLVLPIAVAITLALLIQAAIAKPYEIPTESMDPTIRPGDRVIANRLIYHFRDISRGDIVVFHPTDVARQECEPGSTSSTPFVKRVIGLPGDQVQLLAGTSDVRVNGAVFAVPAADINDPPRPDHETFTVPAGKIFVLGDNRRHSCDSHLWPDPYVPLSRVIGQAEVTYWPLRHVTFLK